MRARISAAGWRGWTAAIAVCAALFAHVSASAQIQVSANVDPANVMVGQRAAYSIIIENSRSTPDLPPPSVDGLLFAPNASVGSSHQIINGVASSQIRVSWSFVAQREGRFTIPAREIEIRGERYRVPEVRFTALPPDERTRNMFFLEIDVPDRPLFVGEFVPMAVRLYVRKDVSAGLGGELQRTGDGFLQKPFPQQPKQETRARGGIVYEEVSWETVVVPIRAGPQTLQYSLPLVYGNPNRTSRDFFGRLRMEQEEILLTTEPLTIDVQEPPAQNRPDSFRDAIGQFKVSAALSSRSVTAGEPITMTLTITGKGNFERISPPAIPETPGWRMYPPKSNFQSDDPLAWTGTRTFEYIMIPDSEMVNEVPGIRFAYFDPEKLEYVETVIDAEPIKVKPAPDGSFAARDFTGGNRDDRGQTDERDSARALLRPIHTEPGRWQRSFGNVIGEPLFIGFNALAALSLLGTVWVRRRQIRLNTDDRYARKLYGSRTVRALLQQAATAARSGDAQAFYHAAQRAIQECVAKDLGRSKRAESLLVEDVLQVLRARSVPDGAQDAVREVFATADALKFAGGQTSSPASGSNLGPAHERLVTTIQTIEASKR